jgi:NADPH:quinone reductase-like Zn-dependent oxidoreductase
VLRPAGTLVLNAGGSPGQLIGPLGTMVSGMVINGLVRPRVTVMPYGESQSQLLGVTELIEAGQVRPVLDRDYPLAAVADGLRYLERGHARGKVTVIVA